MQTQTQNYNLHSNYSVLHRSNPFYMYRKKNFAVFASCFIKKLIYHFSFASIINECHFEGKTCQHFEYCEAYRQQRKTPLFIYNFKIKKIKYVSIFSHKFHFLCTLHFNFENVLKPSLVNVINPHFKADQHLSTHTIFQSEVQQSAESDGTACVEYFTGATGTRRHQYVPCGWHQWL